MSRWFRWYEGTSEDGKFRLVARKSRVTVRDVIALWAFMLEDAAHLDHRGVCFRDEDFMAAALDFENGVVETILSAMQYVDMISVGPGGITICNWTKRQFESDVDKTSVERKKRQREKESQSDHIPVTRDSRSPDSHSDTEINNYNSKKGFTNGNGKYKRPTQHGDKSSDGKLIYFKPGLDGFDEYSQDYKQVKGHDPPLDKHGGVWFWIAGEASRPKGYRTKKLEQQATA